MAVCKDCASCPNKHQKHDVEIQIEDIEFDFTTTETEHRRQPLKQAKFRIRSITPPRCRRKRSSSPTPTTSTAPTTPIESIMGAERQTPAAQPLSHGGQNHLWEAPHSTPGEHLWLPQDHPTKTVEPVYHLKIDVLKGNEWQGDCPTKKFAFKSVHHLTYAINRLEQDFKGMNIRKYGLDRHGDADEYGERAKDGRCENVTIEFKETETTATWKDFLASLSALESEWDEIQKVKA